MKRKRLHIILGLMVVLSSYILSSVAYSIYYNFIGQGYQHFREMVFISFLIFGSLLVQIGLNE